MSASAETPALDRDRQLLTEAAARGPGAKLRAWVKLSGPGWLQSAITLGGGSLASSLFLGILSGYSLLWLQVLAMACGVVMLGAIGYVALSTGQRPFGLVNQRISPVLGWGWALATMAANIVWCLPQFALASAAVTQNLAPGLADQKPLVCGVLLVVAICVTMLYDSGGRGLKIYEHVLRLMVAAVVLCFLGVVVKLLLSGGDGASIGAILAGLAPDLSLFSQPAPALRAAIEATGEHAGYWTSLIVAKQRDVMVSAAATAVGINMTFLFPYSLLKKGWDRTFRGLSIFDLATGMAIPFVVATGCVVVAAGATFHGRPAQEIIDYWPAQPEKIDGKLKSDFENLLKGRLKNELGDGFAAVAADAAALQQRLEALPDNDRRIAATLADRDALLLARALAPLTGEFVANYVFGFGVLAMALSTITILMLISGFTFCEVFGLPQGGWYQRLGSLLPAVGVLGPFVWKKAAFYLAIPTSVFGMALLPIAYLTFLLMMNSPSVLGDDLPRGGKRVTWNVLMLIAFGLSTIGAGWSVWSKTGWYGVAGVAAFFALAAVVHIRRQSARLKGSNSAATEQ